MGVMAVPLAIFGALMFLYRRWAEKRDPMGGRPGAYPPLDGEAKRPDVYHD
ncbi:MAG: hypothetical protein Q7W30_03905 [Coriobacteriia bacterium]|nr:hypothetical protein [Coriobacteriia bacterium]